jgi:hypothetical protein
MGTPRQEAIRGAHSRGRVPKRSTTSVFATDRRLMATPLSRRGTGRSQPMPRILPPAPASAGPAAIPVSRGGQAGPLSRKSGAQRFSVLRRAAPTSSRQANDFAAPSQPVRRRAPCIDLPRLEGPVHERTDVSPARNGLAARCHCCRNRCGLATLIVLDSGVLCCRRCWRNGGLLDTAVHGGRAGGLT